MNQKHLKPTVVHLTIDDEAWLRERRKEQEGNKPHRIPAPPERDHGKEERDRHDKKASLLNIVARFKRAGGSEQASLSRTTDNTPATY